LSGPSKNGKEKGLNSFQEGGVKKTKKMVEGGRGGARWNSQPTKAPAWVGEKNLHALPDRKKGPSVRHHPGKGKRRT